MDGDRSRPMSSSRTAGSSTLGAGWTGADRTPPLHPEATVPPPQAGTFRAAGCGPLQPGTAHAFGDRIPVPDSVEGPRPHKDVPGRAGCPRTRGVRLPVPWAPTMSGALTQIARFAVPPAASTPSSQQPRAGQRHKQAVPHLRCGTAGVGAPVHARYSLPGEDCGRHPPRTPTSASGHRTSSFGGILLPDPPS